MTMHEAQRLEEVDATLACWRVYGLERSFENRPKEGWNAVASLSAEPGVQLRVTIGDIPEHVIEGVKGRWVHGIYIARSMFGNEFTGKSPEEVQHILRRINTDEVVRRIRGNFRLWLTVEARTEVQVEIRPRVRFDWLVTQKTLRMLAEFATKVEPHLDATFVRLIPSLGTSLAPVELTTPRLFPHLIVPGRATFSPPNFDVRGVGASSLASRWEEIDFEALQMAVDGVATTDELPKNEIWRSPNQWLLAAMGQEDDSLRSFLFSFIGLEALTHKFGNRFEKRIVSNLSEELGFGMNHLTWPSPRDSDAPWRNLVYRFALMAVHLAREDADADIREFKELADMRNGMAHGRNGPNHTERLPGRRGIALLRKYIGLIGEAGRNR